MFFKKIPCTKVSSMRKVGERTCEKTNRKIYIYENEGELIEFVELEDGSLQEIERE